MKRFLTIFIVMAILCPAALASTASDIAADYEQALLGRWDCTYSELSYFDAGDSYTYSTEQEYGRSRMFVAASASGTAYLYITNDKSVYMEVGEITISADGNLFVVYKGGSMAVFTRDD